MEYRGEINQEMAFWGRLKSMCPFVKGDSVHSIIVFSIKGNQIGDLELGPSVPFPTVFVILLMTSIFKIGYVVIIIFFTASFAFPDAIVSIHFLPSGLIIIANYRSKLLLLK